MKSVEAPVDARSPRPLVRDQHSSFAGRPNDGIYEDRNLFVRARAVDSGHERSGLVDRSRARHTQAHATCTAVRDLLIELRRETGAGPRQLLWLARKRYPGVGLPAPSTVSSILSKAGLVEPARRMRRDPDLRGPSGPYRAATKPNEMWTVDFKGQFRLGDGSMCHPLTVQDDATRYLLCVDGRGSTSTEGVLSSFRRIFRKHGVPERIHSDNGVPFASTGLGRLSRVSVEWMRQEIEVCRSRPGHPEDNPRHERMHRTLKAKTARPPCATAPSQQRRFGRFVQLDERGSRARGPGDASAVGGVRGLESRVACASESAGISGPLGRAASAHDGRHQARGLAGVSVRGAARRDGGLGGGGRRRVAAELSTKRAVLHRRARRGSADPERQAGGAGRRTLRRVRLRSPVREWYFEGAARGFVSTMCPVRRVSDVVGRTPSGPAPGRCDRSDCNIEARFAQALGQVSDCIGRKIAYVKAHWLISLFLPRTVKQSSRWERKAQ